MSEGEGATPFRGYRPSLGAWPERGGVRFRVWAPERERVEVLVEGESAGSGSATLLEREAGGYFSAWVHGLVSGARYRFRLDGEGSFPDPASRFQPEGVHGPSQVVDPGSFRWTHEEWRARPLEEVVLYELHVGTFTPGGTWASAALRLPQLRDLGVTAVELMPVADFPGRRNWGYDGVCLFAPARCYGTPDDLRAFVDRAHGLGLSVVLDVVYNHLGPDGNHLGRFSPHYFTSRHATPWGAAVNLDGAGSEGVRGFFLENARHWVNEYRFDGLRLDACHALHDDSPRHFLAELADEVKRSARPRDVLVVAEDSRNLARLVRPASEEGFGLDAVWADDLHHQVRVALSGDRDGYYVDFSGSLDDIAKTVEDGWFFQGQVSKHAGGPRGTDPRAVPPRRLVVCLQNHDQVGNRALGERLHHQVDPAAFRAATVLLLLAPETPLLFMGQEWGASSPFLFFTDHDEALGPLVTEGRRREFAGFRAFSDAASRARIPDPQAEETFLRSRLDWSERDAAPHAGLLALHRALLSLRRELRRGGLERRDYGVRVEGASLALQSLRDDGERAVVIVRLGERARGGAEEACRVSLPGGCSWRVRLTTEDRAFTPEPVPPRIALDAPSPYVELPRPGGVVLTA